MRMQLLHNVYVCEHSFAIHNPLAKLARLKHRQNIPIVWYLCGGLVVLRTIHIKRVQNPFASSIITDIQDTTKKFPLGLRATVVIAIVQLSQQWSYYCYCKKGPGPTLKDMYYNVCLCRCCATTHLGYYPILAVSWWLAMHLQLMKYVGHWGHIQQESKCSQQSGDYTGSW